jgi:HSP20 family protein
MANLLRRHQGGEQGRLARSETVWDPLRLMRDLLRFDPFGEMESLRSPSGFVPDVEVRESKDAFTFRVDLPGLKEDDVDIQLVGNRLTISGERQEEKRDESDRYYAYERTYGRFSRTFTLPEGADVEHVTAELKDGVLSITVAKKAEVQPRKIGLEAKKEGAEQQTLPTGEQPSATEGEARATEGQQMPEERRGKAA